MTTKEQDLQRIGQCAYDALAEMVAALQCDYERLEELRDDRDAHDPDDYDGLAWDVEFPAEAKELAELEDAAGDCESEDDARQRIEEDPLSLQLRSGWYSPGETPESLEYELLLGTGGPAVRIIGELGMHNEPDSATLQTQDWFTPWTDFHGADDDVLMAYVSCFYFGE